MTVKSCKKSPNAMTESANILPLDHFNFMQSFRNILSGILEKKCLPTDILTVVISQDPFSPKDSGPKNFGTPTVFEIYKFQKPLWTCLTMPI